MSSGRAPQSVAVESAFERIYEMSQLEPGWDGEDAEPLSGVAVAATSWLIAAVAERNQGVSVVPWTSAPFPDGGLQIEWQGKLWRIEVHIAPNGALGYLLKSGAGEEAAYEEQEDVPFENLVAVISQLVSS